MVILDKNIGKRFNKLTVIDIEKIKTKSYTRIQYVCKCDCGNTKSISKYSVLKGSSTSCGCVRKDKITIHGFSHHPLYDIWNGIRRRCDNKKSKGYKHYGGRGIKYDESWRDNPEKFIEDIEKNLGKRPSKKHSLDRIDNNKGYYIENLRWADYTEQARNKRSMTSTKHYCISEIHDGNFLVTIIKNGYRRQSATMYTIDEAIKIRDLWEKEWEEDELKWIDDTINKNYKKHLSNHKYKNSTGYKCISRKGKGKFFVRVYREKKCRSSFQENLDDAIKIRDLWIREYKNNPDKWIEKTIKNNYRKSV